MVLRVYWRDTDDDRKREILKGIMRVYRKRTGHPVADAHLERLYFRETARLGVRPQPAMKDIVG